MTDRYSALTVVLEHDMRDDDAEGLINAIRHLRGVLSVEGNVADPEQYIATERAKHEMEKRLWEAMRP